MTNPEDSSQLTSYVPSSPPQSNGEERDDTVTRPAGEKDLVGEMLGEFLLLQRIGRGGMADVYLAEQTSLRRKVAIKLVRPEFIEDDDYLQRFKTEALAAAGLNHPNIVQVYMVGEALGKQFIAMEYVQGPNLRQFVKRKGPPSVPVALHIMRQVASALQAASEAGIVHRDIKPENILINRKGEVKVADFGLSQLTQHEDLKVTKPGITLGTPLYMSPEQVQGKTVDARSDIYSFGVTCWHMMANRPPYEGPTAVSVAVQHVNGHVPGLERVRPDLPPQLCQVIRKMMAKNPAQRYQTPREVLNDLRRAHRDFKSGGQTTQIDEEVFSVSYPDIEVRPSDIHRRDDSESRWFAPASICVLTLLGAFALGFLKGPGNPFDSPPGSGATVPKAASAEDQYIEAMLDGQSEEAWRAVIEHWPNDYLWRHRAEQQLAMFYLNRQRYEEAKEIFDRFRRQSSEYTHLEPIADAGEALWNHYQGRVTAAQDRLTHISPSEYEKLPAMWKFALRQDLDFGR